MITKCQVSVYSLLLGRIFPRVLNRQETIIGPLRRREALDLNCPCSRSCFYSLGSFERSHSLRTFESIISLAQMDVKLLSGYNDFYGYIPLCFSLTPIIIFMATFRCVYFDTY